MSAEQLVPWLVGGMLAIALAQVAVLARAFRTVDRLQSRVDRLREQLQKENESARMWRDHVLSAQDLLTPAAARRPAPEQTPEPAVQRRSRSGTPPVPARQRPWSNLRPTDETIELQAIGGRHLQSVRRPEEVTSWT